MKMRKWCEISLFNEEEYFWRENVDCIIKLICVRRILNDISLKI